MKATFVVGGDGQFPQPSYDIAVCFNGVPDTVVLEIHRNEFEGFSGSGDNPVTTVNKQQTCVMRTALKASHARAIASALLSAATEVRA
jgi:hypothetical protein